MYRVRKSSLRTGPAERPTLQGMVKSKRSEKETEKGQGGRREESRTGRGDARLRRKSRTGAQEVPPTRKQAHAGPWGLRADGRLQSSKD